MSNPLGHLPFGSRFLFFNSYCGINLPVQVDSFDHWEHLLGQTEKNYVTFYYKYRLISIQSVVIPFRNNVMLSFISK